MEKKLQKYRKKMELFVLKKVKNKEKMKRKFVKV